LAWVPASASASVWALGSVSAWALESA
jgi:hypothetical protein